MITMPKRSAVKTRALASTSADDNRQAAISSAPSITHASVSSAAPSLGSWDDIVRTYADSVYRLAYRLSGNAQDAEDLTQETFARFFASLDRYKHYGKAANYLYVIAGNLCRDHYRRQSELPLADLPEPADRPLDTLDTRLDLQDAFRVLPPEIQPAAVLFFLQERKQREIAKILGIGLPLVKYRIRKARELLAQFLRKEAP